MEKLKEIKCSQCQVTKPVEEFFYNEKSYSKKRGYHSSLCKDCTRKRNVIYNQKRKEDNIDVEKEAMTILTRLGYDIESEKPIYIQFKERWGV